MEDATRDPRFVEGLATSIGVCNCSARRLDALFALRPAVAPAVNQVEVHPGWRNEAPSRGGRAEARSGTPHVASAVSRRRSPRAQRAESTSQPTRPSAEPSAPAPAPVCSMSRSCVRLQRSSAGRQLRLCCAGPSPAGAASCQRALRGRASRRMRGPCGSHLERAAGRERWRRCEPSTPLSRSSGG